MKRILVVNVDVQNDFARGALGTPEAIAALPVIHAINEYVVKHEYGRGATQDTHFASFYFDTQEGKNLPVLHTEDGTWGWEICDEAQIEGAKFDFVICKTAFGTIDEWEYVLVDENGKYKYDEIWMVGFCTDICVMANFQIIKAIFPEIPIVVISDACAGVTPETHEAALKVMKSCQAKVVTWEELEKENENEA